MKKIIFVLLINILLIQSCVEDPLLFAYHDFANESSSKVFMRITSIDSSYTFFSDTIGVLGAIPFDGLVDDFINNHSSIQMTRLSDSNTVFYYNPTINTNNFQNYINDTPFKVDNWNENDNYKHEYIIKDSNFD